MEISRSLDVDISFKDNNMYRNLHTAGVFRYGFDYIIQTESLLMNLHPSVGVSEQVRYYWLRWRKLDF
jgi:hypothetical protein